jgi:hypothetical protein
VIKRHLIDLYSVFNLYSIFAIRNECRFVQPALLKISNVHLLQAVNQN